MLNMPAFADQTLAQKLINRSPILVSLSRSNAQDDVQVDDAHIPEMEPRH